MTAPRFTQKLNGQRVLLIGGTGGVGVAVAQALVEHGAEIILSSSRDAKVKQVIDDLGSQYAHARSRISGYTCDLASPHVEDNIKALFLQVGKVNHIVYLAGDRLHLTVGLP